MAGRTQADWPQWRGPQRDDVSQEKGLLKTWPEGGPQRTWLFDKCGVGYSGPAIVDGRLYIMGTRGEQEHLLAIDAKQGTEIWASPIGNVLQNNWGDGPRGTPTVDGEFIYAMGGQGNLVCARTSNGEIVWTRSMADLGGETPTWGFTESPLIYQNVVLCTPGGDQGAIVGLNKKTGELLWQTKDVTTGAHYSSMVLADRASGPESVQLLADQLIGLNPTTGEVHWTEPWPGRVAVIPTPIVRGELVYATAGYGAGSKLIAIGDDRSVDVVWDNKVMKNHHGGAILLGDYVYGYSDDRGWLCQEFKTGKMIWREERDEAEKEQGKSLGKGAIAYADGRFYCIGEDDGQVVLIEASPEGWKEYGRFTLEPQTELRKPAGKIWTHPVICDGKLYLRDQELLFCFDISEQPQGAPAGN